VLSYLRARFGWTLRQQDHRGKDIELESNKRCLREFETTFDGEMEAMADLMEYVTDNEISGNFAVHSDSHAAIVRVGYTGPGPGQDSATIVVKAVKDRLTH
jgi:hypothetical protein